MQSTSSESTGLPMPGLRTWRGVYIFIFVLFVAYIVLLAALQKVYSS